MAREAKHITIDNIFKNMDSGIQSYFSELSKLLHEASLEVCLAYVFLRTEAAHHRLLYGGATKIYQLDYELTWNIINKQHMTRSDFEKFYENIFGTKNTQLTILREAEKIRDKIIHGKKATNKEIAEAIEKVLEYADLINKLHSDIKFGGFMPFASMKGFKGRAGSHGKQTTRLVLKGLGFSA